MKINGLKIFKVSKNKINGGSIRCFVSHDDNNAYDQSDNLAFLDKFFKDELKLKIKNTKIYKKFFLNITKIKIRLNRLINDIKIKNKSIYVLGASTKGNTILQFIDIDNKTIPYAIERNNDEVIKYYE